MSKNLKNDVNYEELLQSAIKECREFPFDRVNWAFFNNPDKDSNISVAYLIIKKRLEIFRKYFGTNAKIETDITLNNNGQTVLAKASLYLKNHETNEWDLIQNSHGYDEKNKNIQTESFYIENAETSAIGRCLYFMGLFSEIKVEQDKLESILEKSDDSSLTSNSKSKNETPKNETVSNIQNQLGERTSKRKRMIYGIEKSLKERNITVEDAIKNISSFSSKARKSKTLNDLAIDNLSELCVFLDVDYSNPNLISSQDKENDSPL